MITRDEVASVLRYDAETGDFTWLADRSRRVRSGDKAGHLAVSGYVMIGIAGTVYRAHRLAFLIQTGDWPTADIDHIDGRKANNAWANLRDVSKSVNQQNRKTARCDKESPLGASFHKSKQRWQAGIVVSGHRKHLGYFAAAQEAHAAYLAAKRELHEGCTL